MIRLTSSSMASTSSSMASSIMMLGSGETDNLRAIAPGMERGSTSSRMEEGWEKSWARVYSFEGGRESTRGWRIPRRNGTKWGPHHEATWYWGYNEIILMLGATLWENVVFVLNCSSRLRGCNDIKVNQSLSSSHHWNVIIVKGIMPTSQTSLGLKPFQS